MGTYSNKKGSKLTIKCEHVLQFITDLYRPKKELEIRGEYRSLIIFLKN
jgi:hypothetical protein